MFRRVAPLLLATLCATGCVPVTEPVGNIEKAKPDAALVGKWTTTDSNGTSKALDVKTITVDAPAVKGNPKGLMRSKTKMTGSESEIWFYLSTLGKETYANLLLVSGKDRSPPDFSEEGNFAKWQKDDKKEFFVARVTRKEDALTIDFGDYDVFGQLMKNAKIPDDGIKPLPTFLTPAEWLDKYLAKTGPEKVFNGTNKVVLKRKK
jgi:hypothetical protein